MCLIIERWYRWCYLLNVYRSVTRLLRVELKVLINIIVIKRVTAGRRHIKTLATWKAGEGLMYWSFIISELCCTANYSKTQWLKKSKNVLLLCFGWLTICQLMWNGFSLNDWGSSDLLLTSLTSHQADSGIASWWWQRAGASKHQCSICNIPVNPLAKGNHKDKLTLGMGSTPLLEVESTFYGWFPVHHSPQLLSLFSDLSLFFQCGHF